MRCATELLALSSLLRYARGMSTAEYVAKVVYGRIDDPTLSFKLREGFHVLAVVPHPMGQDPETLGYPRPRRVAQPTVLEPQQIADRPRLLAVRAQRHRGEAALRGGSPR